VGVLDMAWLLASGFLLLIGIFHFTTKRNFRQSPIFGIESTVNRLVTHFIITMNTNSVWSPNHSDSYSMDYEGNFVSGKGGQDVAYHLSPSENEDKNT
jgi:hypothetical protein